LKKYRKLTLEIILREKKKGKKIVFTNGIFDIIHPGHIILLKEAKKHGDILIVGLNTDISTKKNKGKQRPIFPFEERKNILLSIKYVDFVLGFNEKTPIDLIKLVSPDVIVKGGDYKPDKVVGKDFVENKDGKLIIVKQLPEYSTTRIVESIIK